MSSPYSSTSVSGYNANPPPDDGTVVGTNLVTWAVVKSKLGDPLNTFSSAVNSALVTAFGKTLSGASVVTASVNYAASGADQGRLIKITANSVTVTTPDATSVGTPFVFAVINPASSSGSVGGFGGTQTIDGNASIALPAGSGIFLFSDGSNWNTAGQSMAGQTLTIPQGRLTLVSGTPVMTADQSAATAVYFTPYIGNQISIPNGTIFKQNSFAELTLTLNGTNYIASSIYDVFIFLDPGDNTTVRIGTGPAWSTATAGSCARGTGAGTTEIARLNGMWTNNNAATMRNNATTYSVATKSATYVGSIFMDGTNGQVTCHFSAGQSRKFGIWNAYNRVPITLQVFDSTASWVYSSATIRQSRATAGNKATIFSGLAEEWYDAMFTQNVGLALGLSGTQIGIGFNSTTAYSGFAGLAEYTSVSSGLDAVVVAKYESPPSLGINAVNCLEFGDEPGGTFMGGSTNMLMRIRWNG